MVQKTKSITLSTCFDMQEISENFSNYKMHSFVTLGNVVKIDLNNRIVCYWLKTTSEHQMIKGICFSEEEESFAPKA